MIHMDYVWVDGLTSPLIRSKTKVINPLVSDAGEFEVSIPEWNFDGSSTNQATTADSERILQPQRVYQLSDKHYAILCEVCLPDDDRTPHSSNHRAHLRKSLESGASERELWLGFEQEFFLTKKGANVMWPKEGEPPHDTRYYCSSGAPIKYRRLIREFAGLCNTVGISVVGYNTEVSPGQWEYQVFADDPLKASDDLWMSRYLLQLSAETYDIGISWHPKPHEGWNGSGCHVNFSTLEMRESGNKEVFDKIFKAAESLHGSHMKRYGELNKYRMTGAHETSSYDTFTFDVASRSTSLRVPNDTAKDWKGYVEDRRPASNCDPYRVASCVLEYTD